VFSEGIALPLLCLVVAGAATTELWVSPKVTENLDEERQYCRFFVCDEQDVVYGAFRSQLRGNLQGFQSAATALQDALERDVSSPFLWADVGDVFSQLDEHPLEQASACFERAMSLGKASAQVVMTSGAYFMRFGQHQRGEQCIRQILSTTSDFDSVAFSYLRLNGVDFQEALETADPSDKAARAFLGYLIGQHDLIRARQLWKWLERRRYADLPIAAAYSKFLWSLDLYSEAAVAWQSQAALQFPDYLKTQFIYDSGIEQEGQDTGFDWIVGSSDHVVWQRDSIHHTGNSSFRVQFDGRANLNYYRILQYSFLPAGSYRLQLYVRAHEISTNRGPYFALQTRTEAPLAQTEAILGTSDWHPVTANFTLATPQPVMLKLIRQPSEKFDNLIAGTLWIDDITLTRTATHP